eukprot:TRINITY_DN2860_c0_g1_i4.p1 TRINITY_DN2860_c0_g1~~TRINITY_DN2860_c0_g1_i4.p1  ORF type:complete len:146 (+),score=32.14 TRINITY_DN2860_c0_g1_i4:395-832(+)
MRNFTRWQHGLCWYSSSENQLSIHKHTSRSWKMLEACVGTPLARDENGNIIKPNTPQMRTGSPSTSTLAGAGRCWTNEDGTKACVGIPQRRTRPPSTSTPAGAGRCWTNEDGSRACVGTPLARDENGNIINRNKTYPPAEMSPTE